MASISTPSAPAAVDALALAAHRDDVEQTCGGALLRLAEAGARTAALELTGGEMGTRGDAARRAQEAEAAARCLRLAWRGNLQLPDGGLDLRPEFVHAAAAAIRRLRPRLLLLPYPRARHPDHAIAGRLGYRAAFLAGLSKLALPGGEPAFRPHSILYASLYARREPSLIVDISSQFERRTEALLAYRSQYADQAAGAAIFPPEAEILPRLEALARYYGMMIGVRYGEPYISPAPLRAGDLRALDFDTFTTGGLITPF